MCNKVVLTCRRRRHTTPRTQNTQAQRIFTRCARARELVDVFMSNQHVLLAHRANAFIELMNDL